MGKCLSGEIVGLLDWASLGYGEARINTLISKMLKSFHTPTLCKDSWRLRISREVANIISNEGEEAYVYNFAKNQKEYTRILYRPSGRPPLLINDLIKLEKVPLKIIAATPKAESGQSSDRESFAAPVIENMEIISKKPYLYFPHQSIFYGNMFVKDWPFQAVDPKEVAIIEWDNVSSMAAARYEELGVTWTTWGELIQHFGGGRWSKFWAIRKAFFRNISSWSKMLFEAKYHHGCNTARKIFSNFRNARFAFIGYDVHFPPEISQGLKECNISTVAVQERSIHSFARNQNVMADHYIVPDYKCKQAWEKKPFSSIGRIYIGGHWRLETEVKPLLGTKDYILVTDFHAEALSRYCTIVNWDNYRRFYRELLELGNRCPEFNFIIRTKEFMLDKVDSGLFNQMQECGNVNLDPSRELNRSYRLLRSCRLVFGRHSSLMDEAHALGIPVVVHENFCSSLPYLENISADYASKFNITKSVGEAETLIRKRMSEKPNRSSKPAVQIKAKLHEILDLSPAAS